VNIANGNHNVVQLGLVNCNTEDFMGLQAGLANITGGNVFGAQPGLLNISGGDVNGWQGGLLNMALNVNGYQTGLANISVDANGWQAGLLNVASSFQGTQTGLVNIAKTLAGFQLGLVNYAGDVEDGIPIGLVSIVGNGGYHAVEYGFSEFYPVTLGFKIGVEKFYTTFFVAYRSSDKFDSKDFATGLGCGSIIPINGSFFFHPEINGLNTLRDGDDRQLVSCIPYLGYNITKNIDVLVAPSITWAHNNGDDEFEKPLFEILSHEFNKKNSIVVGARANLRIRF